MLNRLWPQESDMFYKKVLCPYCLTEIRYKTELKGCPNEACKSVLPVEYVEDFDKTPPCFAQIIGWSSHGKTVFLQALTAQLMQMGTVWKDNFDHSAQTEKTLIFARNVKNFMSTGRMPPGTDLELQDAYIMHLNGMERWGNRALVLRDVAGDYFVKLQIPLTYMPYLAHVPTTIMLTSLDDLRKSSYTIDELLNSYIQTLLNVNKEFNKRPHHVIVTLSKADLIQDELPKNIIDYLNQDPFTHLGNPENSVPPMNGEKMNQYMLSLASISEEIKDWIDHRDAYGHTLIQRARKKNIDLRFSIISSTGSEVPEDKIMKVKILPKRVLDPFFWLLELQSKPA